MYSTVMTSISRSLFGFLTLSIAAVATLPAQQTQVDAVAMAAGVIQRAQEYVTKGESDSATDLLGHHLMQRPNDGRAWFYLGRVYLDQAQAWHRTGHRPEASGGLLLDFASTSFEPAQQLLVDSAGVFRVLVAVERGTLRVERSGWDSLASWHPEPVDLPLPPVLLELGRNLLESCPKNGVLVTSSLVETASVWGARLQGTRSDLVLVRPDIYRTDSRYRAAMARAIGADSSVDLPAALASAAKSRPVCLTPSVDSVASPDLQWHASRLVLSTVAPPPPPAWQTPLSVFQFGRTGLTGSVWTIAARDAYDLAARRNHGLCSTLFVNTDALTLPAIASCAP
jgi:hypothetical protein